VSKLEKINGGVPHALEKALYRNQFILGPFFVDEYGSWEKTKIGKSVCLTTHPDLNVYQETHENKSITLIGYVLDPNDSDASDFDIIKSLTLEISDFDRLLDRSSKFGGRWILIVDDGKHIRLFHDAIGLRQVCYTDADYTSDLWCASQPGLIAERLKFGMDPRSIDFISSFKQRNSEYWWPGDSSPYREIRHLPPNHYLDLDTGSRCRYWPNRLIEKLPLEEVVEKTANTLQGLMISASNRYDLAVSLTAGWDTRVMLAASRKIRGKVSYMTVKQLGMVGNHADIMVPSLLASKFGLKHDIVEAPSAMSDKFRQAFDKNVPFAHEVWGRDAQAILDYNSLSKVGLSGSASEIGRCWYREKLYGRITPQLLSDVATGLDNDVFAMRSFEKWLAGLNDVFDYNIADLYLWEQRCGRWVAMSQLEFDIAWKDIFTPFNCRELLVNMLAVEEKYRKGPEYALHREVMSTLWPEVLSVPINPHRQKSTGVMLKSFLKNKLRRHTPDFIKRAIRGH